MTIRVVDALGEAFRGDKPQQTSVVKRSVNPRWENEDFALRMRAESATLVVTVLDKGRGGSSSLGCVEISIAGLTPGKTHEQWFPLVAHGEMRAVRGEIKLSCTRCSDDGAARAAAKRRTQIGASNGLCDTLREPSRRRRPRPFVAVVVRQRHRPCRPVVAREEAPDFLSRRSP